MCSPRITVPTIGMLYPLLSLGLESIKLLNQLGLRDAGVTDGAHTHTHLLLQW